MSSNRRQFIRAGAATLATPFIPWSQNAFANATKNGRPLIGLIGVGRRGIIDAHEHNRFGEIVAICDVDRRHAKEANADYYGCLPKPGVPVKFGRWLVDQEWSTSGSGYLMTANGLWWSVITRWTAVKNVLWHLFAGCVQSAYLFIVDLQVSDFCSSCLAVNDDGEIDSDMSTKLILGVHIRFILKSMRAKLFNVPLKKWSEFGGARCHQTFRDQSFYKRGV